MPLRLAGLLLACALCPQHVVQIRGVKCQPPSAHAVTTAWRELVQHADDSVLASASARCGSWPSSAILWGWWGRAARVGAVSYTHLTLPTICSV
eukprot:518325-Alexandrium_andersonii.AAC.1